MTLTPIADNATDCYWIDYTSGGTAHSMKLRKPAGTGAEAAVTSLTAVREAMRGVMSPADSVTGFRFRAASSDVAVPMTLTGGSGTAGAGPVTGESKLLCVQVVGHTTGGRKAQPRMYAVNAESLDAIRIPKASLNSLWLDFYNAIAGPSATWVAVDGQVPLWAGYVNVNHSRYWQNRLR